MSKNVVVDSVTSGGTASNPTAVLHYIGSDNTVWKIANLASKLDESSKAKLRSVKKGDVVSVDMVKEGKFWNLVAVGEPVAETKGKGNSKGSVEGRQTDIEKAQGQQRGNVLTNATNLVVAILTARGNKEELNINNAIALVKDAAKELLLVSHSLEDIANVAEAANQDVQDSLDLDVTDKLGF